MTVFCAKTETFAGTLDLKVPVNAVEDEVFEEGRVCCGNGQNTEWTTWAGRRRTGEGDTKPDPETLRKMREGQLNKVISMKKLDVPRGCGGPGSKGKVRSEDQRRSIR